VSNLEEGTAARQLTLDADHRWEDAERTADALRERFGRDAVTYGALLHDDEERPWEDAPTTDDL
jgi:hypothetical protein